MKNPIINLQDRIDQVTESFNFETVSKVVKALGREESYTLLVGNNEEPFTIQTLKDFAALVMNEAFTAYNEGDHENLNFEMGWFWVAIRNYGERTKVNMSFVIDEMDTF